MTARWALIITWSEDVDGEPKARETRIETTGPMWRLYRELLDANLVPPGPHTSRVIEIIEGRAG